MKALTFESGFIISIIFYFCLPAKTSYIFGEKNAGYLKSCMFPFYIGNCNRVMLV